jgi:hypothetical protein
LGWIEYKNFWASGFAFKDLQPLAKQGICEKFNNNTSVKEEHKR